MSNTCVETEESKVCFLQRQRNRGEQGSLRRLERGEQSLLPAETEEQRRARLTKKVRARRAKFASCRDRGTEESKAH